jgi:hypothetical protein
MAQYYRLPSPGVTSISIDGIEHKVDPNTGIVTVDMMTPNLVADLTSRGAVAVAGPEASGMAHEEHSSGKTQADDKRRAAEEKDKADKAASGRAGHANTPGGQTQAQTPQHKGSHS